ncbi:MAG TPA: chromate efflux transporter [Bacteroidota bacterium]|nr:chromate efflux transporter [Bacteroidota bacterium]
MGDSRDDPARPRVSGGALKDVALLFLRLGTISFGGPAAHIAMMEDEVVKRRKWITHEYFLDLLGATNIIPGPNSTEMGIHIGYLRAGWKGLVAAGVCFILPAVSMTLLLAHLYVQFGSVPQYANFIWGIRAAVIAIILAALIRLGRPKIKDPFMVTVGAAVGALNFFHVDAILLLGAAGVLGLVWGNRKRLIGRSLSIFSMVVFPVALVSLSESVPREVIPPTVPGLGLFFLKIGSILYGSGYVLAAFLQGGLVGANHWLTQTQLLDAIAVGQFTPGPVLSTATFIGYVILGFPGALVSTAGIFLPSFIYVLAISPFVPKLRKSPSTSGFLDGVNAASLGLMLAVCATLGIATLINAGTWTIFIAAAAVILIWNLHAAWIVVGAAILGWIFSAAGLM